MRSIVCVILGLGTISLAISIEVHGLVDSVQYVPLGNKVTIPCVSYGPRRNGKWLHRNYDNAFTTLVHESLGFTFKSNHLPTRIKTTRRFSLEINPFTELDKGTYVCQMCKLEQCTDGKPITLLPQFAVSTLFIIDGDRFSYSCRYSLTQKADWRFEPLGENTFIPVNRKFTNETVLIIPDVEPNNAGRYSIWDEIYTGQQQRMCSVNLCVLSVSAENLTDSPQNCTLYCDADIHIDEGGSSVVLTTDKWNISIIGSMNKPKSSLRCRVETHAISHEDPTATAQPYSISSIPADHGRHTPVAGIISMCIGFLFIVVIALFILLRVSRQRADRNSNRSANADTEETEFQVIYSTLQFGRYNQQNVITSDTECVYGQIRLTNNI